MAASLAAPLAAQPAPAPPFSRGSIAADPSDPDGADILVRGKRPVGAVAGGVPAELEYSSADIRALGISSVSDILDELAPQIRSDRGRGGESPILLLNGKRISSFTEIRDIPAEAILRVDVLPEEVALKYGYAADQRVVNFVLRRRFRATTGEGSGTLTTEGGGGSGTASLDFLRIRGDTRLNFDAKLAETGHLTEHQRGIGSFAGDRPYDFTGNIIGLLPSGEIDPALSLEAGRTVTAAGVPASAANGTPELDDFVPLASRLNASNVSSYRTLVPASRTLSLNSIFATPITDRISGTMNGTLDLSESDSLRGLPGSRLVLPSTDPFSPFTDDVELDRYLDPQPLRQTVTTLSSHLGVSLDGDIARWRLSFTGTYDYSNTLTLAQTGVDSTALQGAFEDGDPTRNPFGKIPAAWLGDVATSRARAISSSGNFQFVGSGPILQLPAGALAATAKIGVTASDFGSNSLRGGVKQYASLFRSDISSQISLDIPLTSRGNHVLGAIGSLSTNANFAVDQLSHFDTLTSTGYGFSWGPIDGIEIIGSTTYDESAPSVQQLGNPLVVTPDVPIFDYYTGRTLDVTESAGGNPDLRSDHRHVEKLGLTIKPLRKTDFTITVNYIHSSIRDAIASFPSTTAAIEAAFPNRFTRDAEGDLLEIDERPVNFAREMRQELRWGFNLTERLASSTKIVNAYRALQSAAGPLVQRPAQGSEKRVQDGRLQFGFYHTWFFRDDILIRQGGPKLDLLDGGTTGSGGGQAQHELEWQLGYSNNGIGARLTGQWKSATTVKDGADSPTGNIHFSSLATANFRLFINFGQRASLVSQYWARGLRLILSVNNILDSRQHVHDANGDTPLGYQPAYLDPLGRTIKISIRKLFLSKG